jgi:predicted DNA-binding transcriptional regulator AlpA
VFWTRYIEPFLENICIAEIAAAVVMAKEKEIDGRLLLTEVRTLLAMGFTRIYNRMADIDRKLRGKGFPKQVELRSVEREIAIMNHFLDEHIQSEIEMWKTNSKLEEWFKKNQFWVWIASVVLAIIALLIKFK